MIHKAFWIIIGMWAIQGVLTYFQVTHYKKTVSFLRNKGKTYVGQERGKIGSGTIVIIVMDTDNNIIDFQEMKGVTVFQKFRKRDKYIGKSIKELVDEVTIIKKGNVTIRAIKKALHEYSLN